jgi:hypothetical protein
MVETRTKLVLKFKMCFLFKFDKNLIKVWPHYGKERFCDLLSILTLFQSEILFLCRPKVGNKTHLSDETCYSETAGESSRSITPL